ncbi:hypothetical protein [Paenibacillus tengchongensis]|uniref:hypothetical protein n=1 Tax=Paenibacillus tengchongensis TaxID=2608684 RepID=UPI00124C81B8|nr:hypothetical protein [Paenibacillus tengchongensis]
MLNNHAKRLSILLLAVLAGCSGSQSGDSGASRSSSAPVRTAEITASPAVEPTLTAAPLVRLIDDLDSKEELTSLTIQGSEWPTTFVAIDLHPYGFYIPETMQEFVFEDGSEVGFSNTQFISLLEADRMPGAAEPQTYDVPGGYTRFKDEELAQYAEYIGSAKAAEGPRFDRFLLKRDGMPETLIHFSYFDKDRDEVLPVFLEVARHMRYIAP